MSHKINFESSNDTNTLKHIYSNIFYSLNKHKKPLKSLWLAFWKELFLQWRNFFIFTVYYSYFYMDIIFPVSYRLLQDQGLSFVKWPSQSLRNASTSCTLLNGAFHTGPQCFGSTGACGTYKFTDKIWERFGRFEVGLGNLLFEKFHSDFWQPSEKT